MARQTIVAATDPVCRKAVEAYAAELEKAGLRLRVREVPADVALDESPDDCVLSIEWEEQSRTGEANGDWEDWDEEPEEADMAGDSFLWRAAEHYGPTFQILARDPDAAAALLARVRRRKRPARGRT